MDCVEISFIIKNIVSNTNNELKFICFKYCIMSTVGTSKIWQYSEQHHIIVIFWKPGLKFIVNMCNVALCAADTTEPIRLFFSCTIRFLLDFDYKLLTVTQVGWFFLQLTSEVCKYIYFLFLHFSLRTFHYDTICSKIRTSR